MKEEQDTNEAKVCVGCTSVYQLLEMPWNQRYTLVYQLLVIIHDPMPAFLFFLMRKLHLPWTENINRFCFLIRYLFFGEILISMKADHIATHWRGL